eukprot:scaffold2255_cov55-Phaeocystis_antarctica.AAC.4
MPCHGHRNNTGSHCGGNPTPAFSACHTDSGRGGGSLTSDEAPTHGQAPSTSAVEQSRASSAGLGVLEAKGDEVLYRSKKGTSTVGGVHMHMCLRGALQEIDLIAAGSGMGIAMAKCIKAGSAG